MYKKPQHDNYMTKYECLIEVDQRHVWTPLAINSGPCDDNGSPITEQARHYFNSIIRSNPSYDQTMVLDTPILPRTMKYRLHPASIKTIREFKDKIHEELNKDKGDGEYEKINWYITLIKPKEIRYMSLVSANGLFEVNGIPLKEERKEEKEMWKRNERAERWARGEFSSDDDEDEEEEEEEEEEDDEEEDETDDDEENEEDQNENMDDDQDEPMNIETNDEEERIE
jgi:hypothetical protein